MRGLDARGADINSVDNNGRAALWYAAEFGSTACVEALLQGGAVANMQDRYGATPLMQAAHIGHNAVCVLLVEAGADPHLQASGGTLKGHSALSISEASWPSEADQAGWARVIREESELLRENERKTAQEELEELRRQAANRVEPVY